MGVTPCPGPGTAGGTPVQVWGYTTWMRFTTFSGLGGTPSMSGGGGVMPPVQGGGGGGYIHTRRSFSIISLSRVLSCPLITGHDKCYVRPKTCHAKIPF